MATPTPVQEHFRDKAIESRLALWNALLTVNGIMLTAFSVIPVISQPRGAWKWLLLVVVASCFVSLVLLVWNFMVMKKFYEEVGRAVVSVTSLPSEGQRKQEVRDANREHRRTKLRERAVLVLFFLQTVLSCVYFYVAGGYPR